jgi:hypothetical protein
MLNQRDGWWIRPHRISFSVRVRLVCFFVHCSCLIFLCFLTEIHTALERAVAQAGVRDKLPLGFVLEEARLYADQVLDLEEQRKITQRRLKELEAKENPVGQVEIEVQKMRQMLRLLLQRQAESRATLSSLRSVSRVSDRALATSTSSVSVVSSPSVVKSQSDLSQQPSVILAKELNPSPFQESDLQNCLLGSGGYGCVYKVKWGGHKAVMKKLKWQKMSPATLEVGVVWYDGECTTTLMCVSLWFQSFQQEGAMAVRLNHPNIIRTFGLCLEPGGVCIVMEVWNTFLVS